MVNKSLIQALWAIRAAVRMKILARKYGNVDERDVESVVPGPGKRMSITHAGDVRRISVSRVSDKGIAEPLLDIELPPRAEAAKTGFSFLHESRLVWKLLSGSYINLLLVLVPVALMAGHQQWAPILSFTLNFIALVPLALLLGDVTEDLAARFGDVVGGLLNATFGNVVEVVLAVQALRHRLFLVVGMSLMGSILSNLLLVLGMSMFVGGVFHHTQQFNTETTQAQSVLLFLAVIGIAIPTCANYVISDEDVSPDWILKISHVSALVLLGCYLCYLFFQLVTHPELTDEEEEQQDEMDEERSIARSTVAYSDEGTALLSLPTAIVLLTAISVVVAVHCDYLTSVIEAFSTASGLGQAFIGMVILPIAGNACEHMAAVVMAAKNKMNLSLGIAVGSGLQIALFAMPFIVLVGWAIDVPFSLDVDLFALLAMLFSVVHANLTIASGRSNWLTGLTLLAIYVLIAATYFYR